MNKKSYVLYMIAKFWVLCSQWVELRTSNFGTQTDPGEYWRIGMIRYPNGHCDVRIQAHVTSLSAGIISEMV